MKNLIAQEGITNPALKPELQNFLKEPGSASFFSNALSAAVVLGFSIGSVIFIGIMLVGGIQWITAGGDKASIESARGRVMSGLVGIFVLFCSYAVIKAIEYFFHVSITTFNINTFKI